MKGRRRPRRWKIRLAVLVLGTGGFVTATNLAVLAGAEERTYVHPTLLPRYPVALVLGTSPRVDGRPNLFFERRMNAAARLFHAGRVEKVLVSGDNGTIYYNEPVAMKAALVSRGVPAQAIAMDFAGFRTLDSIVRAKRVFGIERCVIVTDDFHLPRALHIARAEGISAAGFQTEPLPRSVAPMTYLRETAARTLTWMDVHIFHRQPKFLGPKESL